MGGKAATGCSASVFFCFVFASFWQLHNKRENSKLFKKTVLILDDLYKLQFIARFLFERLKNIFE